MRRKSLTGHPILISIASTTVWIQPRTAREAHGQEVPLEIRGGQSIVPPRALGQPDANGWTSTDESLGTQDQARRYRFSVKERGMAYVYVGDQWYDMNLGLFSMKTNSAIGCRDVKVLATSTESERQRPGFARPDERAVVRVT